MIDSAVAQTRVAVRHALSELSPSRSSVTVEPLVLVALSGGADSLALAAALAFEAPRCGVRAGAIIIDHGLQEGSAGVAARAAEQATLLGLAPVVVSRVAVDGETGDGPEAAAREARYRGLEHCRRECEAIAVLTAHTREDQAEQVLLALARGSGTRAVAGIPPRRGAILRPFLGVSRETTERACEAQGFEPWRDPHNLDPAYTRVRVRARLIPALVAELGGGVTANLARSADLAREDADALDTIAQALLEQAEQAARAEQGEPVEQCLSAASACTRLPVEMLAAQPPAIRNRMLRMTAIECFGQQPTREHTLMIAGLIESWRGQGPIHAPGGKVSRDAGELHFHAN